MSVQASNGNGIASADNHKRGYASRSGRSAGLRPPPYVPLKDSSVRCRNSNTSTKQSPSAVIHTSIPSKPMALNLQQRCLTESSESSTTVGETLSQVSSHSVASQNWSGSNPLYGHFPAARLANHSTSAESQARKWNFNVYTATDLTLYTGPVDVDELQPVGPATSEGPVDVDSVFEYSDEFDGMGDDDADSVYWNQTTFEIIESDDLFRELIGYEVGFEPPIIRQVDGIAQETPKVLARPLPSKETTSSTACPKKAAARDVAPAALRPDVRIALSNRRKPSFALRTYTV